MLHLERLTVGYAQSRGAILAGIDVKVEPATLVCVLGRNGAGKSTLMRTIGGLQPPLAGSVHLEGIEVGAIDAAERARRIALVLTERPPTMGLSVEDVVSLGRQPFTGWRGRLYEADRQAIEEALHGSGAAIFRDRLLDDLSDGERQRVMIARALAQTPELLLLDEITAFLDLPGRVEMMARLRDITRRRGIVTILSSHDLDLSLQFADSVWLLGGAATMHVGPPAELAASGRIGQCFDTHEIAFSPQRNRFELRT